MWLVYYIPIIIMWFKETPDISSDLEELQGLAQEELIEVEALFDKDISEEELKKAVLDVVQKVEGNALFQSFVLDGKGTILPVESFLDSLKSWENPELFEGPSSSEKTKKPSALSRKFSKLLEKVKQLLSRWKKWKTSDSSESSVNQEKEVSWKKLSRDMAKVLFSGLKDTIDIAIKAGMSQKELVLNKTESSLKKAMEDKDKPPFYNLEACELDNLLDSKSDIKTLLIEAGDKKRPYVMYSQSLFLELASVSDKLKKYKQSEKFPYSEDKQFVLLDIKKNEILFFWKDDVAKPIVIKGESMVITSEEGNDQVTIPAIKSIVWDPMRTK